MQQLLASPRIALSFPRRRFDQFFDRPYVVTQAAGHRWRLTLQRLMLRSEIIPSHEQGLHSRAEVGLFNPTT